MSVDYDTMLRHDVAPNFLFSVSELRVWVFAHLGGLGNGGWRGALRIVQRQAPMRGEGSATETPASAMANARWSVDFVHDQFADGRRFRILNVIDDVTKESLAAVVDTSISGRRVARELAALIERRGGPA